MSEVLARVGDKWTVLVVSTLGDGPKRFNELRKALGSISQRMLTLTLRGLERDGLVTRTVLPTNPPRVDYELTRLGRSLLEPVSELGLLGAQEPPGHPGRAQAVRRRRQGRVSRRAARQYCRPILQYVLVIFSLSPVIARLRVHLVSPSALWGDSCSVRREHGLRPYFHSA